MRQKGKLWKRYIQSKDPKVLSSYKQIRNIVRNKTRQTDRFNQNRIAKACKDNPKHFWKYVKAKTKSREPIGDLRYINDNGEVMVAATDDSKAIVLGDFFSSVFCTENDSVFHVLSINKNCDVASEAPSFDMDDIINRLKKIKINKSTGPDMIHLRILYETADQIAYPLKMLFESSFRNKCLPSEWKYANITPLHKKRFTIGPRELQTSESY